MLRREESAVHNYREKQIPQAISKPVRQCASQLPEDDNIGIDAGNKQKPPLTRRLLCVGSQLSTFTFVVLVLVDLLGKLVLLLIECLAILLGQLAVIHLAHVALFLI